MLSLSALVALLVSPVMISVASCLRLPCSGAAQMGAVGLQLHDPQELLCCKGRRCGSVSSQNAALSQFLFCI